MDQAVNSDSTGPVLHEGYYLDNFLVLLEYLERHYPDILSVDEKEFIARFKILELDAQRLYVRLISRKGSLFVKERLNYSEISDMNQMVQALVSEGFVTLNPSEEMEMVLSVFSRSDLLEMMAECECTLQPVPQHKKSLIQGILGHEAAHRICQFLYSKWTLLHVQNKDTIDLFLLLFFGNNRQGLSDFILEDIGVLRYEPYVIRDSDRYFNSRTVLMDLFELNRIKEQLRIAILEKDEGVVDHQMWYLENRDFANQLGEKVKRLFEEMAGFYERSQQWERSLLCYAHSHSDFSEERQIRILDKTGRTIEAHQRMEAWFEKKGGNDWFPEHYRSRLAKKMGNPVPKVRRTPFPATELHLPRSDDKSTEHTVLEYFVQNGSKGFYTENFLWTGLFGLAFWDIIFSSRPGVFFNPFQRGPADLFKKEFRRIRENQIETRLCELSDPVSWKKLIIDRYDLKWNTANHLVSWKHFKKDVIRNVLDVIRSEHLVCILDRMATDLSKHTAGFPDLFIIDPQCNTYTLTEVKGPGDQVRTNQKRWFRFFNEKRIPYQVVHVKWV